MRTARIAGEGRDAAPAGVTGRRVGGGAARGLFGEVSAIPSFYTPENPKNCSVKEPSSSTYIALR